MDLFTRVHAAELERTAPLAHRMRPRTLDEFVGQEHIIGPGRLLRRAIQADQLSSLIFYGPPGTGKTTLAMVIAGTTRSHFITINAVLAGVKQIREAVEDALQRRLDAGQRTTLFVDEVHRWNKAQQDALLPHVEKGTIILIGATTENPYFEVNKALVSRSRIFQLKPLEIGDLRRVAQQALATPDRGYGGLNVRLDDEALDHLVDVANGDARSVLNALELAVETTIPDDGGVIAIDLAVAEESIQRRAVLYDKEGDVHYDTVSAFIKSLRGSDPDAALYWMAKMVYAGEDPRFIFRRMAILASEDVGMADPQAAAVVTACWEVFERIGMPEGRFPLAQAALYLATCPKSNSAFAFFDALETVRREQEADVPNHLKDPSRDKEGFGHGKGYLYPHAYRDHWVAQQYLPDGLQGRVFYEPSDQGYEQSIGQQVARRREAQLAAMVETTSAMPEVLTTGPVDRARDAWLQRAVAGAGRTLGRLRDRLFERAALQRHHLVLDLNAGSGLLTWEALRSAPEGGVWAQTADPQAGRSLRQQADRLPELERVAVLVGEATRLDRLLTDRGDGDVRFDRILGRNPLTAEPGDSAPWDAVLAQLRARLLPDGLVCIVQVIPRENQRLYRLIDWTQEAPSLASRVQQAEESIYADESDPLVRWTADELRRAMTEAGFEVELLVESQREPRRFGNQHLERWFPSPQSPSDPSPRQRSSYAARLRQAGLDEDEVVRVAALYRQQLADRVVDWQTRLAFLTAR
ncbi:MAG: AAA family ATPase [bacterium]